MHPPGKVYLYLIRVLYTDDAIRRYFFSLRRKRNRVIESYRSQFSLIGTRSDLAIGEQKGNATGR